MSTVPIDPEHLAWKEVPQDEFNRIWWATPPARRFMVPRTDGRVTLWVKGMPFVYLLAVPQ